MSRAISRSVAVIAVLLCCAASSLAQQADAWRSANAEYAAGHFREAITLYEGLVRSGETTANLFYNLGNACFRVDDLGRAILNYERALALEPGHAEAATNLRVVREKARALELRKSWRDRAATRVTATQYCVAAAVCFWIAAFTLAVWFFGGRRSAIAVLVVFATIGLVAAMAGLYARENGPSGSALAIITGKTVEARLATADNAGTVLALPPGSEIKILNTRGEWVYAGLPNDLRGWIPAQSAERVRL